jgi:hypothetical protein
MTVRLRPHHLLCMLTFVGKGYTAAFTENYIRIAARLSTGEDILVVEGPDDICAPMLGEAGMHCLDDSVADRDRKASEAVEALLKLPAAPGASLCPSADFLQRMRDAFSAGSIREGCARCEWSPFCTGIANSGFDGALVVAPGPTHDAV